MFHLQKSLLEVMEVGLLQVINWAWSIVLISAETGE